MRYFRWHAYRHMLQFFSCEKRWKEHAVNFSLSEIQYRFFMQMYDHPQQWGSLTDRRVGCRCGLGDHVIDWVRSSNFISWLLYNQCVSTSSCETVNKEWHIFATAKQAEKSLKGTAGRDRSREFFETVFEIANRENQIHLNIKDIDWQGWLRVQSFFFYFIRKLRCNFPMK